MKIGILDIDTKKEKLGHSKFGKFPNIACGKIYGYHKQQGDEIIFPYNGERVDRLYISTIFSWTRPHIDKFIEKFRSAADEIIIGGTGYDWRSNLPPEIEAVDPRWTYDLYDIDYGIGFTSRGCHVACSFCVVARKEGAKEYRVSRIADIVNPKSKHIVLLNNNSLADPGFFEDVEDIRERGLSVNWNQANDITLVTPKHAAALASVNFQNFTNTRKRLHFACDQMIRRKKDPASGEWVSYDMLKVIPEQIRLLGEYGIKPWMLTFYLLIGFDTTIEEDLARFEMLRAAGVEGYAMQFRDLNGKVNVDGKGNPQSPHVRHFKRWVNGWVFRKAPFSEYEPYLKELGTDSLALPINL